MMMGILTGCGGGAIRDVLAGDVPGVFCVRKFYASAAMVGGAFLYCPQCSVWRNRPWFPIATAVYCFFVMRLLAVL